MTVSQFIALSAQRCVSSLLWKVWTCSPKYSGIMCHLVVPWEMMKDWQVKKTVLGWPSPCSAGTVTVGSLPVPQGAELMSARPMDNADA